MSDMDYFWFKFSFYILIIRFFSVTPLIFPSDLVEVMKKAAHEKNRIEYIYQNWNEKSNEEKKEFARQGLVPCNNHYGRRIEALDPLVFAFGLLGLQDWRLHAANFLKSGNLVRSINPWCVIGSTRKRQWLKGIDKERFLGWAATMNAASQAQDTGQGAVCDHLKGFPILIAGEGKNRVREFQKHNIELVAQVHTWTLPEAQYLRLYRSPINRTICLIRVLPNPEIDTDRGPVPEGLGVLPFPEFGVELLENYGVQWDRGWGRKYWRTVKAQVRAREKVSSRGWSLED